MTKMNPTLETIFKRRSVRVYEDSPIPDEDLAIILEATRQAPSAANRQPIHYVIVRDKQVKKDLAEVCRQQHWLENAGVIVVGVGLPDITEKWYIVDTTIAMQNLVLAATSLGYSTCWIGAFDEEKVKGVIGIPDGARVIALTPIGRGIENPQGRERKSFEDLFSLDHFGQHFSLEK